MTYRSAEWKLATVWLGASLLLLSILAGQSLSGFYLDRADQVWEWFLPVVMPTLMLIVGVLVADRRTAPAHPPLEEPQLFWLALGLSVFYLLLVAATIVVAALGADRVFPLEPMRRSNLWLGPVQGLVAAAIGVFFHRSP